MAMIVTFGEQHEMGPRTLNLAQVTYIDWHGVSDPVKTPSGATVNFAFDDDTSSRDHIELDSHYAGELWRIIRHLDAHAGGE